MSAQTLIKLCIEQTGQPDDGEVVCELDSWYTGKALDAGGVMQLSTRADYALHALIELAAASGGVLVPAEQLARDQAVPPRHLELIMTELRRAGLVQSTRGPEGGFSLARPADQISLAEVVSAINGPGLDDHAN